MKAIENLGKFNISDKSITWRSTTGYKCKLLLKHKSIKLI